MGVTPSAGAAAHPKKVAYTRSWLRLDSNGHAHVVEAGNRRDLRILDPVLSYPPTVLGRKRAIVVNLEHIRAIITAHEVLLLNSRVTPFVRKLQDALRHRQTAFKSPQEQQATENGLKLLPFEFVALEVCLEAAYSRLDKKARALEQVTYPMLDELTSKVITFSLEPVKQIISRLVEITRRVQKVGDELEYLLDDDEGMAKMHLTHKLERQNLENSSVSSLSEIDELNEEQVDLSNKENSTSAEILVRHEETDNLQRGWEMIDDPNSLRRDSPRTNISTHSTNTKQLDVEELEMILEARLVQIEGTLNKLSTLRDYINIQLEFRWNSLPQTEMMLFTATLLLSTFVVTLI